MLRILVTGGGGFIGSHLVEALVKDGHKVTVFDSIPNRYNISNVNWICGDITSPDEVVSVCHGQDGIVHLAAISRLGLGDKQPHKTININVIGTANVLEAARKERIKPWVILGSTGDSLGENLTKLQESNSDQKVSSFYGITKFMAELLCRQYSSNYGLKILVLRFGDVYGSKRDHQDKVLNIFISNSLRRKAINIINPEETHTYVFWTDIIDGIMQGLKYVNGIEKSCYYELALYSNNNITLSELVELVKEEAYPDYSCEISGCMISDLPEGIKTKLAKAKQTIGYSPKIDIREGIRRYIKANSANSPKQQPFVR